jgi:hypothetical protein
MYIKCPQNIPTYSFARPSKINPNLDFGFKTYYKSGNPVPQSYLEMPNWICKARAEVKIICHGAQKVSFH